MSFDGLKDMPTLVALFRCPQFDPQEIIHPFRNCFVVLQYLPIRQFQCLTWSLVPVGSYLTKPKISGVLFRFQLFLLHLMKSLISGPF